MKKIKVLQVNKLYYPEVGGIEKTLQLISEGLNKKTDLKVLVCQKKGKGRSENVNGVQVCRTGSFGVVASVPISISFIWELRKMSREMDIVHYHMPFPLGDLACLLSGYKGKVAAYWHSDVVKQKKWMFLYRPIMEAFLKRADVIFVGAKGIAEGSKYLKPYLDKCHVVPFAVSEDILQDGSVYLKENGYSRDNDSLQILFVGRLVYYKGISVLIDAVKKLSDSVHLTVVGDGVLEKEMRQKCQELNIQDRVTFLGKISDEQLKQCYRQADVFVLPSTQRSEAFGLVQLEAMAYGLPVVNTNLKSGVPEVSIHKETGLTVPPEDPVQLAEALRWMEEHSGERVEMGKRARKRVETYYSEQALFSGLMKEYRELLGDTLV